MIRSLIVPVLAAALILPVAPARAQEDGNSTAISTLIVAGAHPRNGEIRGAGPIGDPNAWLTAAEIPEAIRASAEGKSAGPRFQMTLAQVGIELTIEPGGAVSDCRGTFGRANLAPELCPLIRERGKFRHALAADGTPIRGIARLTVQYSINGLGANTGLPPAPPQSIFWPVWNHPNTITMEREPKWARFSRVRDGSSTAIQLSFYNGAPSTCMVMRASGDAALDKATCAAAKTGTYRLDPAVRYQRLPMIVRWDARGGKAQLPMQPTGQKATPENEAYFTLRGVTGDAGASARLSLSETGAVTRCVIETSAGNDAADIAMCKTFSAARFAPARDVFGLPVVSGYRAIARFE